MVRQVENNLKLPAEENHQNRFQQHQWEDSHNFEFHHDFLHHL